MTHARTFGLAVACGLGTLVVAGYPAQPGRRAADGEVVITFEKVDSDKPVPSFTTRGVVFALAHGPTRSRAAGRVMFFPHLKTPRKGILNAMASESIPVEIRFPKPVSRVT